MTNQTRNLLFLIDQCLAAGDVTAQEVATVLSALRGPDEKKYIHIKATSTIPIRRAALPMTAAVIDKNKNSHIDMMLRLQHPGDANRVDLRGLGEKSWRSPNHFGCHAVNAAHVLGLEVIW